MSQDKLNTGIALHKAARHLTDIKSNLADCPAGHIGADKRRMLRSELKIARSNLDRARDFARLSGYPVNC